MLDTEGMGRGGGRGEVGGGRVRVSSGDLNFHHLVPFYPVPVSIHGRLDYLSAAVLEKGPRNEEKLERAAEIECTFLATPKTI